MNERLNERPQKKRDISLERDKNETERRKKEGPTVSLYKNILGEVKVDQTDKKELGEEQKTILYVNLHINIELGKEGERESTKLQYEHYVTITNYSPMTNVTSLELAPQEI